MWVGDAGLSAPPQWCEITSLIVRAIEGGRIHHVIVGSGPAGVTAAETIKKAHSDHDVTLICGENLPPYSRMALPYFLTGQIDESGTFLRPFPDYYQDMGIHLSYGRVQNLFPDGNELGMEDGSKVAFDRLLLATGARPVRPPIPGLDHDRVVTCWTMSDAQKIVAKCKEGADVMLVGAGFIGSIILEALVLRGVNLTVVEMGDRMVPRMMDEHAGSLLKKWCEAKGVTIMTGQQVSTLQGGDEKVHVTFADSDSLDMDLVVISAGVQPNVEFLHETSIALDQGVLVNSFFETSREAVYAAGDVAQGRDFLTGVNQMHAIQPTAVEHGRYAAMNMVGDKISYPGSLQMNVLDTLGLVSTSFGLWQGRKNGDNVIVKDDDDYRYIRLEFSDDKLIGAQTVGFQGQVGAIRGLIQSRQSLGSWKEILMKNPERIAEAYVATLSQGG